MTRPLHKEGERYNVLDFGAVGDGITDDTQAILDAVAESQAYRHGGGIVWFPRGVFRVASAANGASLLFQNEQRIIFEGHSDKASILQFDAANVEGSLLSFVNCSEIEVRNLGFDGLSGSETPGQSLLDFQGTSQSAVINCSFKRFGGAGLRISRTGAATATAIPDGTSQSSKFTVSLNEFFDFSGEAIVSSSGGADELILSNNRFSNGGAGAISLDGAFSSENSDRVVINGNLIDGMGMLGTSPAPFGIRVRNMTNTVAITGNVLSNFNGLADTSIRGIWLESTTGPVSNVTITGNTISSAFDGTANDDDSSHGVYLQTSEEFGITDTTITGNTIVDYYNGVTFRGVTGDRYITTTTISGNTISVNHVGIWTIAGFVVRRFNITGNMIDAPTRGIRLRAREGTISSNTIEFTTPFGIEMVNATGGYLGFDTGNVDVNGNYIEAGTDILMGNTYESYFQIGRGYIWRDGTGDIRVGPGNARPVGMNTAGAIVGTQT